jgi:hypothetical protein
MDEQAGGGGSFRLAELIFQVVVVVPISFHFLFLHALLFVCSRYSTSWRNFFSSSFDPSDNGLHASLAEQC